MNKLSMYFMKNSHDKNQYKRNLSKMGEKFGGSIIYRGQGLDPEPVNMAPIQVKTGESYALPSDYELPTGTAGRRKKNKFNF